MKLLQALTAGLSGAFALTITHQVLHNIFDDAPRMDLMGEEALVKISDKADIPISPKYTYGTTMAGDIAGNALFYSLAAIGDSKKATIRGALLGLVAGIGGVYLPKHIGLTNSYSDRTVKTRLMTIGIYTLGGVVSGKVVESYAKRSGRLSADK